MFLFNLFRNYFRKRHVQRLLKVYYKKQWESDFNLQYITNIVWSYEAQLKGGLKSLEDAKKDYENAQGKEKYDEAKERVSIMQSEMDRVTIAYQAMKKELDKETNEHNAITDRINKLEKYIQTI